MGGPGCPLDAGRGVRSGDCVALPLPTASDDVLPAMSIYADLGLTPVVNANATLTRLGGSLMPPVVVEAMQQAARHFVDLHELQSRVDQELARLTRNEDCYVCCGAASGIVLAIGACLTGGDPALLHELPEGTMDRRYVIVHRMQRNQYDYAVRQAFAKFREVGNADTTYAWELEAALERDTAALIWFAGHLSVRGSLPLEQVISIAHAHDVPVIVDAAAQLPPTENLWRFTEMGADMVIFSGGKDLRGPQSSGLILGRRKWVEACRAIGAPNPGLGRPMKVGKEEMLGLLAAVRRYLALDQAGRRAEDEKTVAAWCETLNRQFPELRAQRSWPNEAGQPLPRMEVVFMPDSRWQRDDVVRDMLSGNPSVSIASGTGNSVFVNPMTLNPGEETLVIHRLVEVLHRTGA